MAIWINNWCITLDIRWYGFPDRAWLDITSTLDENENNNYEMIVFDDDLDGNPDRIEYDEDDDGTMDVVAYDYNQDGEWDKFEELS